MKILRYGALIALGIAVAGPGALFGQNEYTAINPAEQYLQAAADRERAVLNLPPLRRDIALVAAARQHALEMVEHNAISHQFPAEPGLAARGSAAGAKFSLISENVAQSPSAIKIHQAWMNSEGHRHNLLDPNVDAVGIVVIARGRELFAVEDFERTVESLSLNQQEGTVASVVSAAGISVAGTDDYARRACAGPTEAGASRRPSFVMRYTTANLNRIPEQLKTQLATGKYTRAGVAACSKQAGDFSMYSLAVVLYGKPAS